MTKQIVSIDIETTGLSPEQGHTIEFAAVLDNMVDPVASLPCFHRLVVTNDNMIGGQPTALVMNAGIISEIEAQLKLPELERSPFVTLAGRLIPEFSQWLSDLGVEFPVSLAGKNFAMFDLGFLNGLGFSKQLKFRHRVFDPGSMYYDFKLDGFTLPDTKTCLRRAGLDSTVKHRAPDDARDVCKLIRFKQGIAF